MLDLDSGTLSAIKVTLTMAFFATSISLILGTIIALLLERVDFFGKKLIIRINRTLMGVPPVVVGLICYILLMRKGPLGALGILFTVRGMIFAQVLIITPLISATLYSFLERKAPQIRAFSKCMGARGIQVYRLILREMQNELYFSAALGFGRSISEVGAVMLVGGNIKNYTRTMTTAISLLKSQGIFSEGIFLGVSLLLISFVIQSLADFFRKESSKNDNL